MSRRVDSTAAPAIRAQSVRTRPERVIQPDARDVFSQMMIVNDAGVSPDGTVQTDIARRA